MRSSAFLFHLTMVLLNNFRIVNSIHIISMYSIIPWDKIQIFFFQKKLICFNLNLIFLIQFMNHDLSLFNLKYSQHQEILRHKPCTAVLWPFFSGPRFQKPPASGPTPLRPPSCSLRTLCWWRGSLGSGWTSAWTGWPLARACSWKMKPGKWQIGILYLLNWHHRHSLNSENDFYYVIFYI